jgi:hypothetical protein
MSIQRHPRFALLLPLLLFSLVLGRAAHAQLPEAEAYVVEDFENPSVGSGGLTLQAFDPSTAGTDVLKFYNPDLAPDWTLGKWTGQGLSGIAAIGNSLAPPDAEGQQFAYLQSATVYDDQGPHQVGSSLYLDVNVPNSKFYIEIRAAQRAGNTSAQVIDVWVDRNAKNGGLHLKPISTTDTAHRSGDYGYVPGTSYEEVTFPGYVKPGVTHRIEFVTAAPTDPNEDNAAFIDEIKLYSNRPPVAYPVTVDPVAPNPPVHWNKPVTFNLSYSDPEYPTLTFPPVPVGGGALGSVLPSHGTVKFVYGRATYTPDIRLDGGGDPLSLEFTDMFTYTVTDDTDVPAKSNEALVTVHIKPDRAPTPLLPVDPATGLSNIDVDLKSTATGINIFPLPYWKDPDGDEMTVEDSVGKKKKAPSYGNAKKLNNQTVTYITYTITQSKQAGLDGKRPPIGTSDTFDYTIIDGNGGTTTGLITVHYVGP